MTADFYTMGIDVGSNFIKLVLMDYSGKPKIIDKQTEKIRKRNPSQVSEEMIHNMLDNNRLKYEEIAYLASTGEGDLVKRKRGHFYGMTTHARGAYFFFREAVGYCLKCNGDICIATGGTKACFSKFVSDTAPALISMDSIIEVIDKEDERKIKMEDIYTGDGINPGKLSKTTILKSILLPLNQQFRSVFKKLRQRESMEFTSLTTSVSVNKNRKIKIVLGGVDPKPIVVEGKISDNKRELIKQAIKKSRVVDNDMFSRNYRREMINVFLSRSFDELIYGSQ